MMILQYVVTFSGIQTNESSYKSYKIARQFNFQTFVLIPLIVSKLMAPIIISNCPLDKNTDPNGLVEIFLCWRPHHQPKLVAAMVGERRSLTRSGKLFCWQTSCTIRKARHSLGRLHLKWLLHEKFLVL